MLTVRDLEKTYATGVGLRPTSFTVEAGETVTFLGPSGSGKSTLLHCLAGILRPDRGEVVYRGARLDDQPDDVRTRTRLTDFGFLFQFGSLGTAIPLTALVIGSALLLLSAFWHKARRGVVMLLPAEWRRHLPYLERPAARAAAEA